MEAERQPRESLILHPLTGEQIDLTDPTERLAYALWEVARQQEVLARLKEVIDWELLRRLDHARRWTIREGSFKVSAPSPAPVEVFSAEELHHDLMELVDKGELDIEAVCRAVRIDHVYKTQKAGVNALRMGGGEAAEVVKRHSRSVPKSNRRVKVEGGE